MWKENKKRGQSTLDPINSLSFFDSWTLGINDFFLPVVQIGSWNLSGARKSVFFVQTPHLSSSLCFSFVWYTRFVSIRPSYLCFCPLVSFLGTILWPKWIGVFDSDMGKRGRGFFFSLKKSLFWFEGGKKNKNKNKNGLASTVWLVCKSA